jgi:hypothetical protein
MSQTNEVDERTARFNAARARLHFANSGNATADARAPQVEVPAVAPHAASSQSAQQPEAAAPRVAQGLESRTVVPASDDAPTVAEAADDGSKAITVTESFRTSIGDDGLQPIGVRLCDAQRKCRETVAAEVLAFAAEMLLGKREYEATTKTGHGKRNPQRVASFAKWAAELLEMSSRWVERVVRMAESAEAEPALWGEVRQLADVSMRLMLALSEEKEAVTRLLAVGAHRTGGAKAMRATLQGNPLSRAVRRLFTDTKKEWANIAAETPLPPPLVATYPELAGYTTVGQVREALRQPPARTRPIKKENPDKQAPASMAGSPPDVWTPAPLPAENAASSPEPQKTIMTSNEGPLAGLAVLPAKGARGKPVIVLAVMDEAGIDAIVGFVERAKALNIDITKPNPKTLALLEAGLSALEAPYRQQRALFDEAMSLAASA